MKEEITEQYHTFKSYYRTIARYTIITDSNYNPENKQQKYNQIPWQHDVPHKSPVGFGSAERLAFPVSLMVSTVKLQNLKQ